MSVTPSARCDSRGRGRDMLLTINCHIQHVTSVTRYGRRTSIRDILALSLQPHPQQRTVAIQLLKYCRSVIEYTATQYTNFQSRRTAKEAAIDRAQVRGRGSGGLLQLHSDRVYHQSVQICSVIPVIERCRLSVSSLDDIVLDEIYSPLLTGYELEPSCDVEWYLVCTDREEHRPPGDHY